MGGTPRSEVRAIKERFWAEMRSHLSGNPQLSGLEHFDELADAVMEEKSGVILQGTVLGLPALPPVSPKDPAKSLAIKASPQPKRNATGETSVVPAPSKKQRVLGERKKNLPAPTSVPSPPVFSVLLALSPAAPKHVRDAVETVLVKAASAGKKHWRLAFPWTGSRLWYDPVAFRSIHRSNWRFWMAFWEWAFHAPLENAASHRKAKIRATVARLVSPSRRGVYGFMEQLDACPDMYWLRGQPGRTLHHRGCCVLYSGHVRLKLR
ncbi:hypothetical protein DVH05_002115 [Phytophthora capsici]|nr:hypothetical protein DVH05_002115 [Phytophthora capsici]